MAKNFFHRVSFYPSEKSSNFVKQRKKARQILHLREKDYFFFIFLLVESENKLAIGEGQKKSEKINLVNDYKFYFIWREN